MKQTTEKQRRQVTGRLLKALVHIGAILPLALLYWDYQQSNLGADPVREITLRLGKSTLILLMLTLAVTPAQIVLGIKQIGPLRRLLGLYSFLHLCLHLLSFIWLDYLFEWAFIAEAIIDQKYVLVGFTAFLLMLPLALTSTNWSMRRLGKKWKQLHRLSYLAGILAVIHFLWLVKNVYTEPLIYGALLLLLLLVRNRRVKQQILEWRRKAKRARAGLPTSAR